MTHAQIEEAATRLAAILDTEPRKPGDQTDRPRQRTGLGAGEPADRGASPAARLPVHRVRLAQRDRTVPARLARETRNCIRSHRFMLVVDLATTSGLQPGSDQATPLTTTLAAWAMASSSFVGTTRTVVRDVGGDDARLRTAHGVSSASISMPKPSNRASESARTLAAFSPTRR